jgi:organic hydroperoxide reductase OsmC/OhrA
LWFLSIAAKRGFVVQSYRDEALGLMAKNTNDKLAMTRVNLRPKVAFAGEKRPSPSEFEKMHHEAHEQCFIANSVTTEVACDPVLLA